MSVNKGRGEGQSVVLSGVNKRPKSTVSIRQKFKSNTRRLTLNISFESLFSFFRVLEALDFVLCSPPEVGVDPHELISIA